MQKIITLPHCRICVVEVPEDSNGPVLHTDVDRVQTVIFGIGKERRLPPGQWQLLGITPLTEERAGNVVGEQWGNGKYYTWVKAGTLRHASLNAVHTSATAAESFRSLLTSHNLPTDKRMAVLWEGGNRILTVKK